MKSGQIGTIAVTGSAVAAGIYLTGDRFNEGGAPVIDGGLDWSAQFEHGESADFIVDLNGNRHRVGTFAAVNAAYDMAAEYTRLLSRYTRLVENVLGDSDQRDAIYQGFLTTGRYAITGNTTEAQQVQISQMVSTAINFGMSLRILSMMYEAAGVYLPYRPTKWERRGVDLSRILMGSWCNPMAAHDPAIGGLSSEYRLVTVSRHEGWNALGVLIMQSWMRAYLDIDRIPGIDDFITEIQDDINAPEDATVAMGAWPAIIWAIGKAIAVVVGSYLGYRVLIKTIAGASHFAGYNYHYMEAMASAYEKALEDCHDQSLAPEERERSCQEAARLAQEIKSYKPSWSGILRVGLVGALALGGVLVYRRYG